MPSAVCKATWLSSSAAKSDSSRCAPNIPLRRIHSALSFRITFLLFGAQGFHGIDGSCPVCGDQARDGRYRQQQQSGSKICQAIKPRDAEEHRLESPAGGKRSAQTDGEAEAGHGHPLTQHERENVAACCT